jgi:hypothetical protein
MIIHPAAGSDSDSFDQRRRDLFMGVAPVSFFEVLPVTFCGNSQTNKHRAAVQ